jgi:phage shock protein A
MDSATDRPASHAIETLQASLAPQRNEQIRLQERLHQLEQQIQTQQAQVAALAATPEASQNVMAIQPQGNWPKPRPKSRPYGLANVRCRSVN